MSAKKKRKFRVDTHDYGVHYRWATSAAAARQRVVYEIFGPGYEGWDHEYWKVEEVTS